MFVDGISCQQQCGRSYACKEAVPDDKQWSYVQVPPMGQETVVGPGPAPPTLTSTESGSRIVRAGHKRYFFDLGSNNKGQYLRITEVLYPHAP